MSYSDKYLIPHNILDNLSFEQYCSRIPEFYFRKEVPDDVIKNYEVVEHMLALSYYEYRLIDEAFVKAIHSFEMAMRIRYRDFFSDRKKHGFGKLITELSILGLFETDIEVLKYLKDVRNSYSHPERHSFGGIAIWHRIEFLSRLINEMYEDKNLRKERMLFKEAFLAQMQSSKLCKNSVITIRGERSVLFRLDLLFVNNKETPNTYLFTCVPLFDLAVKEGGSYKVPLTYKAKLKDPRIENNVLVGNSFQHNELIEIAPMDHHPDLSLECNIWNSKYLSLEKHTQIQFDMSMQFQVPHIYVEEMQVFQKS